jgi:hypothetical protein
MRAIICSLGLVICACPGRRCGLLRRSHSRKGRAVLVRCPSIPAVSFALRPKRRTRRVDVANRTSESIERLPIPSDFRYRYRCWYEPTR